jgi:hypothetical protein
LYQKYENAAGESTRVKREEIRDKTKEKRRAGSKKYMAEMVSFSPIFAKLSHSHYLRLPSKENSKAPLLIENGIKAITE